MDIAIWKNMKYDKNNASAVTTSALQLRSQKVKKHRIPKQNYEKQVPFRTGEE